MSERWKLCNACKKEIPYGGIYFVCSVSTCRGHATNYTFCSVPCWDGHLVVERHRPDAYAIEKRAPKTEAEAMSQSKTSSSSESKRRVVVTAKTQSSGGKPMTSSKTSVDGEVLVVASKVKKYILERHGLNTSASTFEALSEKVKRLSDDAAENAKRAGRKTVMDRDF